MSLHGTVAINGWTLMHWSARRIKNGKNGKNTYDCKVSLTATAGGDYYETIPDTWQFTLKHKYEEGASVLAAKVLLAYTKRAAKSGIPVAPETS